MSLNRMSEPNSKRPPPLVHIVDDDEGVRIALKALIAARGWRSEVFASGNEYLSAPDREEACLLLDLHMPGMSGADVLDALRLRGRDVAAVVMTAHPKSALLNRVRALGFRQILLKPFDESELEQKMEAALEIVQRREQKQ